MKWNHGTCLIPREGVQGITCHEYDYCSCDINDLKAKLKEVPWTEEEWSEHQKLSQEIEKEDGWIPDQASILTWNRGWVAAMRFAKNRIKERGL